MMLMQVEDLQPIHQGLGGKDKWEEVIDNRTNNTQQGNQMHQLKIQGKGVVEEDSKEVINNRFSNNNSKFNQVKHKIH